jgi:hypothetical protein
MRGVISPLPNTPSYICFTQEIHGIITAVIKVTCSHADKFINSKYINVTSTYANHNKIQVIIYSTDLLL